MPLEHRDGYVLWEGGPVPGGADGITLPGLVIVRSGHVSPYLLRHELVHVRQWRRYGVVGFSVRYAPKVPATSCSAVSKSPDCSGDDPPLDRHALLPSSDTKVVERS